jgi:hypothetical protein
MAPVVRVKDEEAPLRQEVGVGGGVGEEAVAARLHVAVEDHHHREGPFAAGQVGEAMDPEALGEVGELNPCEAGAFLQDALHAESPLPVRAGPKLGKGEYLGLDREAKDQKPGPEAHTPSLRPRAEAGCGLGPEPARL